MSLVEHIDNSRSHADIEDEIRKNTRASDKGPPKIVWHYTTSPGFKGIMETCKIWATDYAYLNDSRELSHGHELPRNEVTHYFNQSKSEDLARAMMMALDAGIYSFRDLARIMITCFCERADSLDHWRGYGSPGYCLGFDSDELLTAFGSVTIPLTKVVYSTAPRSRLRL